MLHLFLGSNQFLPLIEHFPVILLLAAPFLVVVGVSLSEAKRGLFFASALTLMVLGTAMTFVDGTTREAAVPVVGAAPAFQLALEEHRALAETTRELFVVLTLGFAGLLFLSRLLEHELESRVKTALFAVYLVFYATGAILLVDTTLQGGQLVRELGSKTTAIYQPSGKESAR